MLLLFLFSNTHSRDYSASFSDFIQSGAIGENVPFYLSSITFESDVTFERTEFFYLTGLKPKTFITVLDVDKAYKYLMYKKRFKQIDIDVSSDEKGKHLHFKLYSNWLFKKLVLKGILFGKHQYSSLYLQQSGDVFDISLHEESVKSIKKFLYDKGYFNCLLSDELIYKKSDKSIIAVIAIKKRKPFFIEKIKFALSSSAKENKKKLGDQLYIFHKRLKRIIGFSLLERDYSKDFVLKQIEKIKIFFKKEGFLDCRVSVSRLINIKNYSVQITFNVKLGKRQQLVFTGNRLFSDKQIREDLLGDDYPSWFFTPEIIAEQLLHEYYSMGYWKTRIYYKKIKENSFLFDIKEGNPVLIDDIVVKDLSTNTVLKERFFFADLLKKKAFDEKLLQVGAQNLKKFYLTSGFWDFSIIEKRFIKKERGKHCTIVLSVQKGEQRFWGGFKIDGFQHLQKDRFFEKYLSWKSELVVPFNFYWLQEQKNFLLNRFQQEGYWYVDVRSELLTTTLIKERGHLGSKVFVNWKVNLGPKIKFGKVLVRGDTRLPFKKILKELRFKRGDLWNREKLDLSRRQLKKLDVFKHVQLQPYRSSNKKTDFERPVVLNLIDDDPVQARFRVGYFLTSKNFLFKRASTFKFGTSLVIKNPTNHVDRLMFNADLTRFDRKFDVDYQLPSPFGLTFDNSFLIGKFKAYTNKYVHPVQIGDSGSAYEALQSGFLFGLTNEYKQDYFLGVNVGNEWMNTSRVRGELKLSEPLIDQTLPFFFIEPSLVVDKLDDRLDVKKGSLSFLSLKFMIPEYQGDVTGKLMAEQSLFHPLYKDVIAGIRFRFGHIFRREFDHILPVERFYLGGPYSVRGYEKDAVPPLGVKTELKPDGTVEKKYTIQGGGSMMNGNLELRFPVYGALRGVVFQDIGVLSQSGLSGFNGRWYPASGFGLRYKTPIGAIRFDIGWKWKHRLPGDSAYAWYLTLGEAF